jgi:hypothetical protein
MKLRFSREDIGMHITLSLIGVGVGFLIGAYISSRMREEEEIFVEVDVENRGRKKTKVARLPRTKRDVKVLPYDPDELDELTRSYSVSQLQIQMIQEGLITLEQLEKILLETEYKEGLIDYAKPDLDELVEYEEDFEYEEVDLGQYEILVKKPTKNRYGEELSYIYDPPTGAFYEYVKGVLTRLEHDILEDGEEVLERVGSLFGDIDTVYILDTDNDILYEIKEDPENFFDDDTEV